MFKITSFTINHNKLKPGVYLSRKDQFGSCVISTFDLRVTSPNEEPVLNTAEIHTIEHLAATYLRNHPRWGDRIVYFGPMGCRTGFYLIVEGDVFPETILPLLMDCFKFISKFRGDIPGATPEDCGNYLDMNLPMAKYVARKYHNLLKNITLDRMAYSE